MLVIHFKNNDHDVMYWQDMTSRTLFTLSDIDVLAGGGGRISQVVRLEIKTIKTAIGTCIQIDNMPCDVF